MVFWVILGGTETGLADKNEGWSWGIPCPGHRPQLAGGVGSLAERMLRKCLTAVRAEVDMVVAKLRVLLLKAPPVMWKRVGPKCREPYLQAACPGAKTHTPREHVLCGLGVRGEVGRS